MDDFEAPQLAVLVMSDQACVHDGCHSMDTIGVSLSVTDPQRDDAVHVVALCRTHVTAFLFDFVLRRGAPEGVSEPWDAQNR